jgi:hypothetical protein
MRVSGEPYEDSFRLRCIECGGKAGFIDNEVLRQLGLEDEHLEICGLGEESITLEVELL